MKLKPLAAPDYWDFPSTPDQTCLVTDDGSSTTAQVAQSLLNQGWQVVVLSFPQFLIPVRSSLPAGVRHFVLNHLSEEHLQAQLGDIFKTCGLIGTFIHLHPLSQGFNQDQETSINSDQAIVKQVFLLAKHHLA